VFALIVLIVLAKIEARLSVKSPADDAPKDPAHRVEDRRSERHLSD
jgi:hypothetical protein